MLPGDHPADFQWRLFRFSSLPTNQPLFGWTLGCSLLLHPASFPFCVFAVLGTKPRTSHRTGKCPATELHPQPCCSLLERVLHYHKSTVCLIIPHRVKTDITNTCLCSRKDSTRTCHGNSISLSSATELGIIKISDICKLHYNLILLSLFQATKTFGKMC